MEEQCIPRHRKKRIRIQINSSAPSNCPPRRIVHTARENQCVRTLPRSLSKTLLLLNRRVTRDESSGLSSYSREIPMFRGTKRFVRNSRETNRFVQKKDNLARAVIHFVNTTSIIDQDRTLRPIRTNRRFRETNRLIPRQILPS